VINRLDRQIDIEVGPVEVVWIRKFNMDQFTNTRLFEPRELLKRNETFRFSDKKPEAVARNVRDLNRRSGRSSPAGYHFRAPESVAALFSNPAPLNRSFEPTRPSAPTRTSPHHQVRGHAHEPLFLRGRKVEAERTLPKDSRTHFSLY